MSSNALFILAQQLKRPSLSWFPLSRVHLACGRPSRGQERGFAGLRPGQVDMLVLPEAGYFADGRGPKWVSFPASCVSCTIFVNRRSATRDIP